MLKFDAEPHIVGEDHLVTMADATIQAFLKTI